MDSRKPLTAGEIEELRELEAKATPVPEEVETALTLFQVYDGRTYKNDALHFHESASANLLRSHFTTQARRIAELEAKAESERKLYGAQIMQVIARAEAAEAWKARVLAWARGRCNVCGKFNKAVECKTCVRGVRPTNADKWTPPSEWEVPK